MRKRALTKVGLFLVCSLCLYPLVTRAEGLLDKVDLDIQVSGSLDFYTDYVWRGFVLSRSPVLQPGVSIGVEGLTVEFWSSWEMDKSKGDESDEVDLAVDYTHQLNDLVSVSVGHTYYYFPQASSSTREFYAGIGLSRIPGLDLPVESSFTYYRDHKEPGTYFSLGLGYSHALMDSPETSLDLGLQYGFNRKLFIEGSNGRDLALSTGLTVALTENMSVVPTVNYSIPFGDLRSSGDGGQSSRLYFGVGIVYDL